MVNNYEKLQRENTTLNEDLNKSRYDLEQIGISDTSHKELVKRLLKVLIFHFIFS